MSQIAKNLRKINQQILRNVTGSPPTLIAVTKTRSVEEINEAISLGIKSIGENRVQEAEVKFQKVSKGVEKRLVGSLQSNKIKKAVVLSNKIGLEVHAGHGLTYKSAKILSKTKGIKEFNIGHFLIGDSIFLGLANSIKHFKKIVK